MDNYDDIFNFGKTPFPIVSSLLDDVEHRTLSPLSFLREFDYYWMLEFDLPFVNKKNLKVIFDGNTINIEAKLKDSYSEESLGCITKFEYFKKSILLPGDIDNKKTSTKFQKGRLEIKIPKKITGTFLEII